MKQSYNINLNYLLSSGTGGARKENFGLIYLSSQMCRNIGYITFTLAWTIFYIGPSHHHLSPLLSSIYMQLLLMHAGAAAITGCQVLLRFHLVIGIV